MMWPGCELAPRAQWSSTGQDAAVGLHLVRSYSPFDHSYRKEVLARVDGSWRKQRDRLRHCCANRAIWIHSCKSVLHCSLFLQRAELAYSASAGFQVVLVNTASPNL